MIYISHRGNISEKNVDKENSPKYIMDAITKGFNVELDVWKINGFILLGHDNAQYKIEHSFFKNGMWCHAKNLEALNFLLKNNIHCFWHQEDDYTLTSENYIWVYPNKPLIKNSICVLPENTDYTKEELKQCYAICSDNIKKYVK